MRNKEIKKKETKPKQKLTVLNSGLSSFGDEIFDEKLSSLE